MSSGSCNNWIQETVIFIPCHIFYNVKSQCKSPEGQCGEPKTNFLLNVYVMVQFPSHYLSGS